MSPPSPLRFHNRVAAFLWGFAAVFMLLLVAMGHVFLRDGPPPGHSLEFTVAIFAGFWTAWLGLAAYAASQACVRVTVAGQAVSIRWRYPFKTESREVSRAELKPARLVESRDDEDNPYFHARIELPDGAKADLWEGHDRATGEATCARFNAALGWPGPGHRA